MLPTLEDYKSGCTSWSKTYRDFRYKINHHGVGSEVHPMGIWCFYVFIRSDLFLDENERKLFDLNYAINEFAGSKRRHFPYDNLPELPWHGGPTYGERHENIDRLGNPIFVLEIGCDYTHLFDQELGYPYSLDTVTHDAKAVIDALHSTFKIATVCAYSGLIGPSSEFYKARNGAMVHKSKLEAFTTDMKWPMWLPAEE